MGNYAVVPLGEIVVVGGLHSALSYGSRRWWWGAKRCFRN